jgi:hypothetical protein
MTTDKPSSNTSSNNVIDVTTTHLDANNHNILPKEKLIKRSQYMADMLSIKL